MCNPAVLVLLYVCQYVLLNPVYCPSAAALIVPRQIPVHLFFLAIKVRLLLDSESGSYLQRRLKMELILWPTIEFDNEKKMQYLYD